jgi:hypothetical protein
MKICTSCRMLLPDSNFYARKDSPGKLTTYCKKCQSARSSVNTSNWRRRAKERLVAEFGSVCADCGCTGPPYLFDFDHRDPAEKEFSITSGKNIRSYERMLTEAKKCDLVCANCHRHRTHKQRCTGCIYCIPS